MREARGEDVPLARGRRGLRGEEMAPIRWEQGPKRADCLATRRGRARSNAGSFMTSTKEDVSDVGHREAIDRARMNRDFLGTKEPKYVLKGSCYRP